MAQYCATCRKTPPEVTLKRCAKCSLTPYCSRDCQKADWKAHKKVCGRNDSTAAGSFSGPGAPASDTGLSPPKGLDQPIAKPFTRLDNGTWLHDRSEKDVYRILIDAYRLRVQDIYTLENEIDDGSLYAGEPSGLKGLQRFLRLASSRPGLLPPWWSSEKQRECEDLGMDPSQFQNLRCAVQKSDIIEHYGDSRFPMQLRMFAEAVYCRGPGGQDGTTMRKAMVAVEQGTAAPWS
ncbi:Tudor domain-containing protein 1 [Madurella mycetomatis]|uniref:Tudor domain-containing protein 1 n=1 Tax=Madurella mycetomatis TaxID=100816 RepID=A0A175VY75_9PEZI|nr:Tudor domain-containing protein 1 [Madurella mycetomatis]KXX78053.1 Tudor domain-containing protein 1 [Madurella mycetomatis]